MALSVSSSSEYINRQDYKQGFNETSFWDYKIILINES